MSKEKQIDEMAIVIDEFTEPLSARDIHKAEFSEQFAEHLYNAGYRKQIEVVKEFVERLYTELRVYGVNDKFNKSKFLTVVDDVAKEMKGGAE